MTAILGMAFPVTATWEDDMKMTGKSFLFKGIAQMFKMTGKY